MQMMLHQAVPFVMCVLRLAKKMQIMVADSRRCHCHTVQLDLPRRGIENLGRGGRSSSYSSSGRRREQGTQAGHTVHCFSRTALEMMLSVLQPDRNPQIL